MNSRYSVIVSLVLFALVWSSCSGSDSPFPGSGADDEVRDQTGAWIASLAEPSAAYFVRPPGESYGTGDGSSWDNALSGLPEKRVRDAKYYFSAGDFFDESLDRVENYIFDDPQDEGFIWLVKATAQDHGTEVGYEESLVEGPAELGPLSFVTGRYVLDGRTDEGTLDYGFRISHRDCELRETDFIASPIFFPWNSKTTHLLLRNVEIVDCGSHNDPTVRSQDAVYGVAGVSHFSILDSYLHDAWRNLVFLQDSFDIRLEGNVFERAGLHHEASTLAFRNSRNVVVIRNWMQDSVNSFISLQGARNVTIASNVLTRTIDHWDNWSAVFSQEPALNVLVAHNTFFNLEGLNTGIRFTAQTKNLKVINNLWAHNRANQIMLNGEHGFNGFWDNWRVDGREPISLDDAIEEESSQMIGADPFVDSGAHDLHLGNPTDPGAILDEPFLDLDLDGKPRHVDGRPDRGAYEYSE